MSSSRPLLLTAVVIAVAHAFAALPEEASISLLQVHVEKQGPGSNAAKQQQQQAKPAPAQGATKKPAGGNNANVHHADANVKPVSLEEQQHKAAPQQQQAVTQQQGSPVQKDSAAAREIAQGIKLLRESLSGQFMASEKAKQQTKASYEANLSQQAKDGHDAMKQNANLSAQVAKLDQSNAKLYVQAIGLQKECNELQVNIQSLEDNITTAQDFVSETFRRMDNATADPVLSVLDELEQSDKEAASSTSHSEKLHAIERLSMLAISSTPSSNESTRPEVAGGLLKTLGLSLDEAALAEQGSEEHMETAFQTRYTANAEKLANLEEEHQALLLEVDSKRDRQTKLTAAVQVLTTERDQLVSRRKQAAKFWRVLSSGTSAKK